MNANSIAIHLPRASFRSASETKEVFKSTRNRGWSLVAVALAIALQLGGIAVIAHAWKAPQTYASVSQNQ